jgi:hypothetical protein
MLIELTHHGETVSVRSFISETAERSLYRLNFGTELSTPEVVRFNLIIDVRIN